MSQVELEGVTKDYGSVTAVDALDLTAADKELLVLVGPSGCGKSTVLRLIAGLEVPTSGRIRIGGQVVNDIPPKDRDIAMVFQNYALYPHMSVEQNLAFGLRMRGMPKREIESRVDRTAAVLGIDALLDRKPGQLSGGQRQRVAVGRAIVRDPSVFLLDEPLSNLDAQLRVAMRAELVKLHRQLQTTMIYVTHDQVEAMTMGERIVVMKDGRLQQTGSPREVYEAPVNRFVAEFIGNPPMNFLEAKLVADDQSLSVAIGSAHLALTNEDTARYAAHAGKRILFGIRPEDIRLAAPDEHEKKWRRLPARTGVSQHLGADTIVELDCAGQTMQARVDPRSSYSPNTAVDAHINITRCRLFDHETEQAL